MWRWRLWLGFEASDVKICRWRSLQVCGRGLRWRFQVLATSWSRISRWRWLWIFLTKDDHIHTCTVTVSHTHTLLCYIIIIHLYMIYLYIYYYYYIILYLCFVLVPYLYLYFFLLCLLYVCVFSMFNVEWMNEFNEFCSLSLHVLQNLLRMKQDWSYVQTVLEHHLWCERNNVTHSDAQRCSEFGLRCEELLYCCCTLRNVNVHSGTITFVLRSAAQT